MMDEKLVQILLFSDISEIVGFIVSIAAILYLFLRPVWDLIFQRKHPEEYAQRQQEKERRLQQLLGNVPVIYEEEEEPPAVKPPRPIPRPKQQEKSALAPAYANPKAKRSRGALLMRKHSMKEAIVLREILGPPKAFQDPIKR